jgi:hypothetical protein
LLTILRNDLIPSDYVPGLASRNTAKAKPKEPGCTRFI